MADSLATVNTAAAAATADSADDVVVGEADGTTGDSETGATTDNDAQALVDKEQARAKETGKYGDVLPEGWEALSVSARARMVLHREGASCRIRKPRVRVRYHPRASIRPKRLRCLLCMRPLSSSGSQTCAIQRTPS